MAQPIDAAVLLDLSRDNENYRESRPRAWYGYSDDDGWGAKLFASALFRGQGRRYLPTLPSIARGLASTAGPLRQWAPRDQAQLVLRVAQSKWFGRELDHHPITSHAATVGVKLNRLALAQHYGIPTGYLDLTDDLEVAAFFATCQYTPAGWVPFEDGLGIVYRINLDESFENPLEVYQVLGPQVLPRPSEQCAWVTELPTGVNFESWPGVSTLVFQHRRSVGEYFLRKFDGGKALFPVDPLATVAADIMACAEIPDEFLESSIHSFTGEPNDIQSGQIPAVRRELATLTKVVRYRRLLSDEMVSTLMSDFQRRAELLAEVKASWRFVRSG
jgi:hypothetical protein